MSRPDIYKDGKKFTSEYQPSPEKKRVKKYKYWAKKALIKNLPALDEQLEKGNVRAFEVVKEWGYGKEADKIEFSGDLNTNVKFEILGIDVVNKDNI